MIKLIVAAFAVAMPLSLSACTAKVVEVRQVVVTPTSGAAPTLTAQQLEYLKALATAQSVTPTMSAPPSPLPDRTTCEDIKGTDYRSATEREWYLAHCVPTPPPAPPPYQGPRFVGDNQGAWCANTPPVTIDRQWQVSAPRETVRPQEIVQIGLRNKFGGQTEGYGLEVRVVAPDGSSTTATSSALGTNWAYLVYPTDFVGAGPVVVGVYTIIWTSSGGFLACDGFVVTGW